MEKSAVFLSGYAGRTVAAFRSLNAARLKTAKLAEYEGGEVGTASRVPVYNSDSVSPPPGDQINMSRVGKVLSQDALTP